MTYKPEQFLHLKETINLLLSLKPF